MKFEGINIPMKDHDIYLSKLEDMIESGDYNWALDTLEGIYDWVLNNQHITEKQMEAVDKIEESKR